MKRVSLVRPVIAVLLALPCIGCPVVIPGPEGPEGPAGPEGPQGPPGPTPVGGFASGVNVTVLSVEIPDDFRPIVQFSATDDLDNPLARSELTDVRLILGRLNTPVNARTARYESYTTSTEDPDGKPDSGDEAVQAAYDSARLGGVTQNPDGTFAYRFAAALPEDYPVDVTHQVAGQFRRVYAATGVVYTGNAYLAFRPDGQDVVETREVVETASCNVCHTRLGLHGDARREVQLCIMCHNRQTADANSGNSVDFPELIHKIHMGANLPSVQQGSPYQIIGFGNSVHDYSTVVYPQDVRNCATCHASPASDKATADYHLSNPSRAGCASCHDRIWFGDASKTPEGFENHVIAQVDDTNCAICHQPTGGIAPIADAHALPEESEGAPGFSLAITDIETELLPAEQQDGEQAVAVSVTFVAKDGAGKAIKDLAAVGAQAGLVVAWPVREYEQYVNENFVGFGPSSPRLVNHDDGSYTYTLGTTFPASSSETYGVGMQGRIPYTHEGVALRQGTATNGVTYFTLNGAEPDARRVVVDEAACAACHGEVRMHGELRVGVDLCVMCHNPNTTDAAQRPADAMPPVSVNFKDMIHRVHSGENLEAGYTVYGFGQTRYDLAETRFPGKREECSICHADGSTELPVPPEALSTLVAHGGEVVSETLPTTAACTSCHDGPLAVGHADLNGNVPGSIETCALCHGAGAMAAADLVHQMTP